VTQPGARGQGAGRDPSGLLRLALAHHQGGRGVQARALYQDVLAMQPGNPDALHLLGLIEIGDGQTEAGIARIRAALAASPGMAAGWSNLGTALRRAGKPEEALECFGRALALTPGDADALAGMGHALRDLGRTRQAVETLARVAGLRPQDGSIRAALGLALQSEGRHAEAEMALREAMALRPADATIPLNLGVSLRQLGRTEDMAGCFRRALELRPNYPEALINLGAAALEAKSFAESEALQRRALAVRPDSVEAHLGLGNVLMALERPEAAVASYREALRLAPGRLSAHTNLHAALVKLRLWDAMLENARAILAAHPAEAAGPFCMGDALMGLDRFEEAIVQYRRALARDPLLSGAHEGVGNGCRAMNRLDEAEAAFRQAVLIAPENSSARANLAVAHLAMGNFTEGLEEYEARWDCDMQMTIRPRPDTPVWTGAAALAGRRILLQAEQGFGDTLQMIRYVPMVAARGAQVVLEVQPKLKPLLAGFPGTVEVISAEERRPETDLHITLMSLPRAFGTQVASIPADVPYLAAPPAQMRRWAGLLKGDARPRVGIAWAGNPGHRNDRHRSIPLGIFRRVVEAAECRFVPLQVQVAEGEAALLAGLDRVADMRAELTDFAHTAAATAQMDLVITVDTVLAHLAAALARPTWVLLPFSPDWRWLMGREDSPWYPTARLFRQPGFADWDSVVDRVAVALRAFVSALPPR
jgi:tetratricopeptide (TPR) repeat protein